MSHGEMAAPAAGGRDLLAHRALAEVSRVRLLEELCRSEAALDVVELAGRVGLHPNTVRSHLEVLLNAGLITGEAERREAPGRPRVFYRAAPQGEESSGFRLLAHILASYLAGSSPDPEAAAIEAGRAWGRYLVARPAPFARISPRQALERVTQLLEQLNFRPKLAMEGNEMRIDLHNCPFRDLASTHPEVTCSVHLGLIRGALADMGAPLEGIRLDPFVKPSLCVAHFAAPADEGRRRPREEEEEA